jgi:hypothetical protein
LNLTRNLASKRPPTLLELDEVEIGPVGLIVLELICDLVPPNQPEHQVLLQIRIWQSGDSLDLPIEQVQSALSDLAAGATDSAGCPDRPLCAAAGIADCQEDDVISEVREADR